jgi:hypothetical protein
MKYEVRYLIDEQEHTDVVDVDTAAEAAARVQERHLDPVTTFELIQVHLVEEDASDGAGESETVSSPA